MAGTRRVAHSEYVHLRPKETYRASLERHRRRLGIAGRTFSQAPARSLERAGDGARPEERVEGAVLRLLPLLAPVVVTGSAVLGTALRDFGDSGPSGRTIVGVLVLLAAAALAEAFPVPLESPPAGYVSLAAVFLVGTGVVYGRAAATIVAFFTRTLLEIWQRRPLIRLVYHRATYSLGGAAAGGATLLAGGDGVPGLLLRVLSRPAPLFFLNLPPLPALLPPPAPGPLRPPPARPAPAAAPS